MEDRPPIGATLREARIRQDLAIAECARATRIRERYLVAIEDGRFESLPDPAYVNGFVRAYATHLGVRVDGPVRELPSDHSLPSPQAGPAHHVRATRARPRRGSRRGSRRRLALVAVVALAVVLVVLSLSGAIDLPVV